MIQHVTARGIERREIFLDDVDREDFVSRLERLVPEAEAICFAWALMPNHVHLVLQTGPTRLSTLMARLGTGYARYFNTRHDRSGHLFQNRFHSVPISDGGHLRETVRYVHANPLRAGLVGDLDALERSRWTGLSALCGHHERGFQAVDAVLRWFADDPRRARRGLRRWMAGPTAEETPGRWYLPDLERNAAPPALRREGPQSPPSAWRAGGWNLDRLISWACAVTKAEEADVRSGCKAPTAVAARALVAHLAATHLGLPGREVGAALGLGESGVSRARRRGIRLASEHRVSLPASPVGRSEAGS